MPKRGLRLDIEDYNHIVYHRYLAKKRKDPEARVRLRSILLVHEGKTLEQVGQILEVARSTGTAMDRKIQEHGRNGLAYTRTISREKTKVKPGTETRACYIDSRRA